MKNKAYRQALEQCGGKDVRFAYIDLFCGAGGVSTGIKKSKYSVVIACANHDAVAIASHKANHKKAIHFTEDVRMLNLDVIVELVADIRRLYPHIKIIIWASCECTHFSKALGGGSRDADSRTLAKSLHMVYDPENTDNADGFRIGDSYIQRINPDYIQIENVVEFMSWGPLAAKVSRISNGESKFKVQVCHILYDEDGKIHPEKWVPESRTKGKDFMQWKAEIDQLGYRNEWRELNAANYGAYTSRNRLFGIFAKGDLPIVWPEATHSKEPVPGDLFNAGRKKWKPVRDCIDFTVPGKSIFYRKKPLAPKTLERLYAGLVKFVALGDTSFLSKYYSGHPDSKNITLDAPAGSITTIDSQALVTLERSDFMVKFNNNETVKSLEDSCPTLLKKDKLGLVLLKYHGRGENLLDPAEPSSTLTTKDRIATVFIDQQYGQSNPASVDDPLGALTQNPKFATCFIDRASEVPEGTYIMSTQYSNIGSSLDRPCPVITANRKHHYLVSPQYNSKGGSIDEPSFTLIARMDKMPPYLVSTESGEAVIVIYESDSDIMKKIKILMAHFGISDIKMRMLIVKELKKIQGFPADYILKGTQTDQKKFIGNAVVSDVVEAWINALAQPFVQAFRAAA